MNVPRLLAKRSQTPDNPLPAESLAGHLTLVGRVAARLLDEHGPKVLASLGLDSNEWMKPLREAAVLGALVHDIGKASEQFQRAVRGRSTTPQALRHDVVGLWLLSACPALTRWLFEPVAREVRFTVLRAVAGHHLRFDPGKALQPRPSGDVSLRILTGHSDFTSALKDIGIALSRPAPPALPDQHLSLTDPGALKPVVDAVREIDSWWQTADHAWRRLAAAAVALIVAADVCASAVLDADSGPAVWATEALATVCTDGELRSVADRNLGGRPLRGFQRNVESSSTRLTIVTAGCGTGKTVAAYRWAARRAAGRKLFFCYPTTGTASEGFLGYTYPELGADAALVHSRAAADIVRFLENAGDDGMGAAAQLLQYQGLQPWGAKVTVCTVDAVLGVVQHHRVGVFGFPALANAAFVFDEIHLYDDRLFGSLLAFVEAFRGSPMLLMTATLQSGRLEALRSLAHCLGETLAELTGPPDLEWLPRYIIRAAELTEARREAFDAVRAGGHVLWVVNTVDRAVALARGAQEAGIPVEPYHSRYRYRDRLDRHRAVVARFRPGASGGGLLAVTTQVCEVSLDISADLLVTELADVPALIQRLGRLNRWATAESNDGPKSALVVQPPDPSPYDGHALDTARRWLTAVRGRPVSQGDLAAALQDVDPGRMSRRVHAAWLDDAWGLEPAPLREPGATVPVIRAEDLPACLDAGERVHIGALVEATIPMLWGPVAREAAGWRIVRGVLVAPEGRIDYSPQWGAKWR